MLMTVNRHLSVYTSPPKNSQIFVLSSLHPISEPHLDKSEICWPVKLVGIHPHRSTRQLSWSASMFTTQATSQAGRLLSSPHGSSVKLIGFMTNCSDLIKMASPNGYKALKDYLWGYDP